MIRRIITLALLTLAISAYSQEVDLGLQKKESVLMNKIDRLRDSLTRASLPTDILLLKLEQLDSLKNSITGIAQEKPFADTLFYVQSAIQSKVDEREMRSTSFLDRYNQTISLLEEIADRPVGLKKIDNPFEYNLPTFPAHSIPEFDFKPPSMDLAYLKSKVNLDHLPQMTPYLSNLKNLVLGGQVDEIFLQQFNEVQEIHKLVNQGTDLDKVLDIKQEVSKATELDPNMIVNAGEKKLRSLANDHLSKYTSELSKAQELLGKHKRKYKTLSSLKEVPKIVPNQMKGLPLKQRLVPGFGFGKTHQGSNIRISPKAHYRITGKLNLGVGYSQSIGIDPSTSIPQFSLPTIGYFTYGEAFIYKTFYLFSKYGRQGTPQLLPDTNEMKRNWNAFLESGIGKAYKIGYRTEGRTKLTIVFDHTSLSFRQRTSLQTGVHIYLKKSPKRKLLARIQNNVSQNLTNND